MKASSRTAKPFFSQQDKRCVLPLPWQPSRQTVFIVVERFGPSCVSGSAISTRTNAQGSPRKSKD